ncbi:MAG: lactate racemase domain-containing protein [Candidatus Latescibacterota bacterium]|nr:lactate racemase domain-containing protein [Candidatus Latescibacterota bacterium]
MQLPKMAKVKQHFSDECLSDVSYSVKESLIKAGITDLVKPGQRIAVSSGSRGISNIHSITRTVVDAISKIGGKPFVLPAMGSHGGATSEGQKQVLASYGIDENSMECPIEATMDVVEVGNLSDGTPVLLNRLAFEADGVILVNRVKPHTSFRGQFESGLMKMMTIGLGSHQGATIAHSQGAEGLARLIPAWGKTILKKAPILMGLAIVENAYEQTLQVEALTADKFISREPHLLEIARRSMPQILCEGIDVLIVDQIGKNISGTGMDTNIIGRMLLPGVKEPTIPGASRIVALNLSDESHGNANGVGLADIITRRLFETIDFKATYANVFTHTFLNRANIPVIMESDQKAIEAAVSVQRLSDNKQARIVRINNTLDIGEISVSESLLTEVLSRPDVELINELTHIQFDSSGSIL